MIYANPTTGDCIECAEAPEGQYTLPFAIDRTHPLIEQLGGQFSVDSDGLDEIFRQADMLR
jgi:hypothetical protein